MGVCCADVDIDIVINVGEEESGTRYHGEGDVASVVGTSQAWF
jgi:hypothetical protein